MNMTLTGETITDDTIRALRGLAREVDDAALVAVCNSALDVAVAKGEAIDQRPPAECRAVAAAAVNAMLGLDLDAAPLPGWPMPASPTPVLYVWLVAAQLDAGDGCQALGFMASGQLLIQSKIILGTDQRERITAVAEVTDWMRKHRPEWEILDDNMTVHQCPFDARTMVARARANSGR